MIRWVFFDVGNVLCDEDPLTYVVFRRHWDAVRRVRPDIEFHELLAARERKAAEGSRWPLFEAVSAVLDESGCAEAWRASRREVRARFAALSPPIVGAAAVVARLAERYRLGLIANQGGECRARLADLGLLARFEVAALSEEQGAAKPDPALFLAALRQADAPPADCLMVGDRLDNDIAPAAALGMKTAWVRWPRRAAKGWNPDDPDALAWRDSLERTARLAPLHCPGLRPTVAFDEIGALVPALAETN